MDIDPLVIEEQYEQLLNLISQFSTYGPFAGILLTLVEAFFPPLPLVVFVTINVIAYGFFQGYIYSFIGTFIGSLAVYLLIDRFAKDRFRHMVHRSKRFDRLLAWIRDKGFVPVFVLFAFPLTPSIVVCGLAGLAGVKHDEYVVALFFGKAIMVLSLSTIGYNLASFVEQPLKSALLIGGVVMLSFLGRKIIQIYESKILEKKHK